MLSLLLFGAVSLDNGLGLTPPMGWMSWEQYHCTVNCSAYPKACLNEDLIVNMIDRISGDGWRSMGYNYVSIDDCWSGPGRDSNGELYPDPERFPNGMAWLADYAHKHGVKFGIYNDFGTKTCGGYTGSEGHLNRDARTFAAWGVDMLKMDGCNSRLLDMADAYPAMSAFLNITGRPILYSCSWPAYDKEMDYSQLPPICNMWRNYGDIRATWSTARIIIDKWGNMTDWIKWAGPGHWNDPDQLMIGMTPNSWVKGLTVAEWRTQFAIWAILAAPLFMSNDLRNVSATARTILMNKEIIAVNQDPAGRQGRRLTQFGVNESVWVRELAGGDVAVALMNRGETTVDITAKFNTFGNATKYKVRDLWQHADLGVMETGISWRDIEPHDTIILRLTPA
jgi:alpha-N-acetylgalactosaminidase